MTKEFQQTTLKKDGKDVEVMLLIPDKVSVYLYTVLQILCDHIIREDEGDMYTLFNEIIQDPIIIKVFFIDGTLNIDKLKLETCMEYLEGYYKGVYFPKKHILHYQNIQSAETITRMTPIEFTALMFHYNPELTGDGTGGYQLQFYKE